MILCVENWFNEGFDCLLMLGRNRFIGRYFISKLFLSTGQFDDKIIPVSGIPIPDLDMEMKEVCNS